MRFKFCAIITFAAALVVGCSSSHKEAVKDAPQRPPEAAVQDSTLLQESESQPSPLPLMQNAKTWSPRFIPTGSASGIMVEFIGLKKNAELHARYAGIELQRIAQDSSTSLQPKTLTLTTTINDLRQAFFKVPPGNYLLRQTKEWADVSYIQHVEVREGNYSVVTIEVLNPRAPKFKQVSDTTEKK